MGGGGLAPQPGRERRRPWLCSNKTHLIMLFTKTVAAVAGALLLGAAAHAATVPSPVSGELFIGFRAAEGPDSQGASTAYLIKLGTELSFNASAGSTVQLSLGNLGADLVNIYGADWSDRSDLYWGVFGFTNGTSVSLFASRERPEPLLRSEAWGPLDELRRSNTSTEISAVINGFGGYKGSQATTNSSVATIQQNDGRSSSYEFQVDRSGTDFGSLSGWSSIEGSFADGSEGTLLDLYRINSAGTTYRGAFSINDSGVVSFTAAVPEPSTAAALLGGAALLFAVRRRRSQQLAAHA